MAPGPARRNRGVGRGAGRTGSQAREAARRLRAARRAARFSSQRLERAARGRLRRFRQGSVLAIALTGLLLLLWGPLDVAAHEPLGIQESQATSPDTSSEAGAVVEDDPIGVRTVRDLLWRFYGLLPRLLVAVVLVAVALVVGNAIHWVLRRTLGGRWERADAFAALVRLAVLLLAIGAGLSVIAGDARALVGSVGLAGLALSWALQTPIESFTGWLLNSFRGYYRVGDRIEVGQVFGDVYRIDVLTTTVWEAGGPGKAVAGAQATGAMITFPNWEILRSNIINYTREFPYVWDEVHVGVDNASDLRYAGETFHRVAQRVFGSGMEQPAEDYRRLLQRARLAFDIAEDPQVFASPEESFTKFTIRYMVPARQRRRWASELVLALSEETRKPEHAGRIIDGYPVLVLRGRSAADPDVADEGESRP